MLVSMPDQPIKRIDDLLPWDLIAGSAPFTSAGVKTAPGRRLRTSSGTFSVKGSKQRHVSRHRGRAQEKARKSAAPFRSRSRHRLNTFLCDDGFPVRQLLERFLTQPFLGYLLRDQAQCISHSVKDGFRSRRTTRDIVIDRDHLVGASQHVVGVKPATSSRGTGTNCECELRVGNSLHQSP